MKINKALGLIIRSFLNGLLIVIPIGLTFYLIISLFNLLDGFFNFKQTGLGVLVTLTSITFVGYLASKFFAKPLFNLVEKVLTKAPFIRFIYSSIKDLMEAFVGEKRKFNKPVLVKMGSDGVYKLGFLTENHLESIGMEGYSAVYLPHSYNISGNVYIIESNRIKELDVDATELMKFIVSGGVTKI